MSNHSRRHRALEYLLSYGAYPGEASNQRGKRRIIVGALWFSLPPILLSALAEEGAGLIASGLGQTVVHLGALLLMRRYPQLFRIAIYGVFTGDIASDMIDTLLTGGLFESGLQVIWSLIAVLGSLVALRVQDAFIWFGIFITAVAVAAASSSFIDPTYVRDNPTLDGAIAIIGVTIILFAVMAYFVRQRDRFQRQSDDLLYNILPGEIADRLKEDSGMIAERFDDVSVLFADVVNFTPMSATMTPTELVGLLDEVFSDIDAFVAEMGLEKIKTIGDEYMVAAGVPKPRLDHAQVAADLALRIRDHVATRDFSGQRIAFRIGINSGSVVAGIIGRRKFSYDLWGDVVNTASRMESHGAGGKIQITKATYDRINGEFVCERRGVVDVKGKGELETWFLIGRR